MRLRATKLSGYGASARRQWTPAQLSTALWLDAADASTITLNGSTVSQWNDKSGNARNAVQAISAYQPLYSATAINNKPAVVTDGVDDALFVNSWGVVSQPFTRAFVFNPVAVVAAKDYINSANIDVPSANASSAGDFSPNTTQMSQYAGTVANAVTIAANLNYIRVSEFSAPSSRVYMNGVVTGPADSGANTSNGVCIGGYSTTGSGASLGSSNVRFGEVLIIPGVLSTDNRQKLEGYLAWKWGLQASLPVSHPYYSAPPLA